MIFPSIDIQGSIISSDLLGKIRSEQAVYQQGKDFNSGLTNPKLKDEISSAWQDAKGQWAIFQNKLSRLKQGESGTTETRNFWVVPFLTNLGYNLTFSRQSEEINGKLFPISYKETQIDGFPVYIGGFHESLDKRPENKQLRFSPHSMVQEYLNYSEHLFGIVTNGKQLRLLRDASRLTRLSYVEFNLQKIMEEDLYSDFVLLYRLLHISRMPQKMDGGAESIIEKYHQEGLEAGSTIRDKLGIAVKESIKALANGFINHPDNTSLRQTMDDGQLKFYEYYHLQLRIIYRLLFLFVIEERNLVFADSKTPETKRFNHIYFNHYSLLRLRKLARKLPLPDAHNHYDLWQSLLSTFALFEKNEVGEKLGIMALQGDIFSYDAIETSCYDLHKCRLSNAVLINVIKSLGYFENDNGVLIPVNYGGLDVEEFGSVYEGLLELKLNIEPIVGSDRYSCNFDASTERSKSGSHYTPEELVQPLIKHSLDYQIADKLKESDPEAALLSLKVCDVACGSGHILLSAARRIAHELACVKETKANGGKEIVEQPSPIFVRQSIKLVVKNCIYGVDKNPLAVELCKIALWLEAHNPGEPLNFLDHHIKCGDAIVGLAHRQELENGIADEAFKSLPGDDKVIAKTFRDKNSKERKTRLAEALQLTTKIENTTVNSVQEAMAEYKTFNQLPESNPDEIGRKAKAYQKFIQGKGFTFLKAMADTQVAQFFIAKTEANKEGLMTDNDFRQILSGYQGWQDRRIAKATVIAQENRFFHWFLEFPDVFSGGGFDCILGNPPFLGGSKISTNYGESYLNFILENYKPIGSSDLIVFFLRRITKIISQDSIFALISTKSIYEGKSREGGFEVILRQNFKINFVNPSLLWPGVANLFVCLFAINNKSKETPSYINNQKVELINQFLVEGKILSKPFELINNLKKIFEGSKLHGEGFFLNKNEANNMIEADNLNAKVIFPLINGDDLNENPEQKPNRYVINFQDKDFENAKLFTLPFKRVETLVKPERDHSKRINNKEKWWIHAENRPGLYGSIVKLKKCFITASTSKYLSFSISNCSYVFTNAIYVYASDSMLDYCIVQTFAFEVWARVYSSSLGNTMRFTPSSCFVNFPFPQFNNTEMKMMLNSKGEYYHEHRKQLMLAMQLGLTKTYNAFHAKELQLDITTALLANKDKKAIEKEFGKEVWNLWNHLQKTAETFSLEEAISGIVKLRELHIAMDNAVLEAYGWADIQLRHDFYEVDYLPENDRVRFTIHPEVRKEILKRLLELNHQVYEEEIKQGLHKQADVLKFYEQKGIPVPEGTTFSDKKVKLYKKPKSKKSTLTEPEVGYGDLFNLKEE